MRLVKQAVVKYGSHFTDVICTTVLTLFYIVLHCFTLFYIVLHCSVV